MFKSILAATIMATVSIVPATALASGSDSEPAVNQTVEKRKTTLRRVEQPVSQPIKINRGVYVQECSNPIDYRRTDTAKLPGFKSGMPVLMSPSHESKMNYAEVKSHCVKRKASAS